MRKMAMKCAYHPQADAVGACVNCGRLVCVECKVELQGKIYCNACAEKMLSDKGKREVSEPLAGTTTDENTSGHGTLADFAYCIRHQMVRMDDALHG